MKSHLDLVIYQKSFSLALEVHYITMKLPKYELYEQGSQIRRSSKSIKDNIAEGFGRRRYKAEFIRYLIFAHSSCSETLSQLTMINIIYTSLSNETEPLIEQYDLLGKQLNTFIQYVETKWRN